MTDPCPPQLRRVRAQCGDDSVGGQRTGCAHGGEV
jgi:hypothetical protein